MELFEFTFTIWELILFGILLITFAYQVYFYCRYLNGIWRLNKKNKKNYTKFLQNHPPVSVIICAKNEAENLRKFLPLVLEQDYPDYEVIVIDDASDDDTQQILNNFREKYPRLYTTFIPHHTKNISTKKLGLSLGIKAAKNDLLLFTDADCMPDDKQWISRMTRNFTKGTEVVLAYGAYFNRKGFLNKLITYDTLFIAMQYMGMAIAKKPYMGVGRNLAYRKETFKKENGFVPFLSLRSGDDDLFVNRVANPYNVRVEVSKKSVTRSEPNLKYSAWKFQKARHLSVSPYYKKATKRQLFFEPFFRGLFYLFLILTIVFGNLITICAAILLFLLRWGMQLLIINRTSTHFGERKYFFSIIFFDIFLPLNTLSVLLSQKTKHKKIVWK